MAYSFLNLLYADSQVIADCTTDCCDVYVLGNSSCIVSLNGDDYVEETCAKYYPTVQGSAVHTVNGLDVTLMRLVSSDHVTRRVLRLSSDTLGRHWDVTQFQLQSWKMYDQVYITLRRRGQEFVLEGALLLGAILNLESPLPGRFLGRKVKKFAAFFVKCIFRHCGALPPLSPWLGLWYANLPCS